MRLKVFRNFTTTGQTEIDNSLVITSATDSHHLGKIIHQTVNKQKQEIRYVSDLLIPCFRDHH